jgi:hypothetical protein
VTVRTTDVEDPACALYAFTCVTCGTESPWFEAAGDVVRTIRDAPTEPNLVALPVAM